MIPLMILIIVILPKTGYPKTHDGDIDRKSPFYNPLFFGHFAQYHLMSLRVSMQRDLKKTQGRMMP